LLLLSSLTACTRELPTYQEQSYVFGTLVEVSIYGEADPKARQATAAVMHEFQRLHNMLHAWQPSELSALNAAFAQGKSQTITPELAAILRDATQLSKQSNGLFNPAIGGLIAAWGFQADEFKAQLPDEKKIAALVQANPQMSDIVLNGNTASSRNRAVQIDLGGYAKGYALDRAAAILKQQGVRNALINIGGNVMALGTHGKRPWQIGIQHPRKPGPLATLELHDGEAVGTSGDYQRYFEVGGKRYCHLIDPATGQPVQGVQAVTILTHGASAGTLSDAASKPLFIAGEADWQAAAEQMKLESAMLVDAAGDIHVSRAMAKRLKFADKETRAKVETEDCCDRYDAADDKTTDARGRITPKVAEFNVALFSYRENAIYDVKLNGHVIGVDWGQPHGGGTGVMAGEPMTLGKQQITWEDGRTGAIVYAANVPVLSAPADDDETYLSVHIYPDNSVELVHGTHWPRRTPKGRAIDEQWAREHGLEVTGCGPIIKKMPLMARLTQQQKDYLLTNTDHILHHIDENVQQLFPQGYRQPYADRCRYVATELLPAAQTGLTGVRDLVNYVALTLVFHERLKTDPHVAPLLEQVRKKEMSLDDALKQMTLDDATKQMPEKQTVQMITSRTRDVEM
jgi:thiamine biosynthesis lipoprotein